MLGGEIRKFMNWIRLFYLFIWYVFRKKKKNVKKVSDIDDNCLAWLVTLVFTLQSMSNLNSCWHTPHVEVHLFWFRWVKNLWSHQTFLMCMIVQKYLCYENKIRNIVLYVLSYQIYTFRWTIGIRSPVGKTTLLGKTLIQNFNILGLVNRYF